MLDKLLATMCLKVDKVFVWQLSNSDISFDDEFGRWFNPIWKSWCQQFWKANSKLKMADREQGIKNLASKLLGGRISTDPAVTRLVSRSSTTSESSSVVASASSLPLLYLCDSQGASADPPKRWGNASSTWVVKVLKRKSKADLGWEGRWGG